MGKINSKQKGKSGELEFAHECEKYGFQNVHRTAQTNGKLEHSLADCEGLDGIHIEVKRVERLNIDEAMEQYNENNRHIALLEDAITAKKANPKFIVNPIPIF